MNGAGTRNSGDPSQSLSIEPASTKAGSTAAPMFRAQFDCCAPLKRVIDGVALDQITGDVERPHGLDEITSRLKGQLPDSFRRSKTIAIGQFSQILIGLVH